MVKCNLTGKECPYGKCVSICKEYQKAIKGWIAEQQFIRYKNKK